MMDRRLFLGATTAALARPAWAKGATLFAAASLKPALDELGVTASFAGSGLLARQILQGAPADVFISANQHWMDTVEAAGKLVQGTRIDLLKNELVLLGKGEAIEPEDLAASGAKIATGFVEAVPAGQYAKRALKTLGLWDAIAPNVIETDNVRAAVALVERGEVPYALAYRSDAASLSVLHRFDAALTGPITYPMALIRDTARARDLYETLRKPPASDSFARHGFEVL